MGKKIYGKLTLTSPPPTGHRKRNGANMWATQFLELAGVGEACHPQRLTYFAVRLNDELHREFALFSRYVGQHALVAKTHRISVRPQHGQNLVLPEPTAAVERGRLSAAIARLAIEPIELTFVFTRFPAIGVIKLTAV